MNLEGCCDERGGGGGGGGEGERKRGRQKGARGTACSWRLLLPVEHVGNSD